MHRRRRRHGARFAVQASVAYKGHWVRDLRSVRADGSTPEDWRDADQKFDDALAALTTGVMPIDARSWLIEGNIGSRPLSILGSKDGMDDRALRAGTVRVISLRFDLADGPWPAGKSVVL